MKIIINVHLFLVFTDGENPSWCNTLKHHFGSCGMKGLAYDGDNTERKSNRMLPRKEGKWIERVGGAQETFGKRYSVFFLLNRIH